MAGDREASSRVFCRTEENEWVDIVEEAVSTQTEEETTSSL
jgi:hypothetical protein